MFDKLLLIGKVWYVVSFSRMLFYKELLILQYSKDGICYFYWKCFQIAL